MTTVMPWRWARGTRPAAGCTLSVEPTASRRSQSDAPSSARASTSGSSDWPKLMVADLRIPPPPHGAVQLDHMGRPMPGTLVEFVDVLGDQHPQPALALELDQGQMPGI